MSPLHVRSKVCMAPFSVRSQICIAPIHVRSKFADFAPHMYGSNADFAPHLEGSHADFAPRLERRHSFRDQQIAFILIFGKFLKNLVFTTYIEEVNMTYVTNFNNRYILRESTFKIICLFV